MLGNVNFGMINCFCYLSSRDEPSEDDKNEEIHGHVNSISVLRSYRRLGLAKKLMLLSRMPPHSAFLPKDEPH